MQNFVAIDFETANFERSSVCSVGIVVARQGELVDSFYSLIHPVPNYYHRQCMDVHGLGPDDTDAAPLFPEVWREAMSAIGRTYADMLSERIPFVAHNKAFDESCLKAVFDAYNMPYPGFLFKDTLWASRAKLPRLVNHKLENHHHALADAEACAWIARKLL